MALHPAAPARLAASAPLLLLAAVATLLLACPVHAGYYRIASGCSGTCSSTGRCMSSTSQTFSGSSCPQDYAASGSSYQAFSSTCGYTKCWWSCDDDCAKDVGSSYSYTGDYRSCGTLGGYSECKCCKKNTFIKCLKWLQCTWVADRELMR